MATGTMHGPRILIDFRQFIVWLPASIAGTSPGNGVARDGPWVRARAAGPLAVGRNMDLRNRAKPKRIVVGLIAKVVLLAGVAALKWPCIPTLALSLVSISEMAPSCVSSPALTEHIIRRNI